MSQHSSGQPENFLQDKVARLDAVYRRSGRACLNEYPIGDVSLLLAWKEMEFRDLPRGGITEEQKRSHRLLELEIKDISAYVAGFLASADLSTRLRAAVTPAPLKQQTQQSVPQQQNQHERGYKR